MTRSDTPALLLTGPPRHGVVRYAGDLAERVRGLDAHARVLRVEDPADLPAAAAGLGRAHLHVTDRLLGSSPDAAADVVERLAAACRLTVTLHDVPQESDGARNLPRRAAAYARVAAAAAGVAVNSRHEALLLAEHGVLAAGRAHVVPLGAAAGTAAGAVSPARPADAADTADRAPVPGAPLVALVAGFLYPGKGHDDVVRAVADAADLLRAAGTPPGEVAVVAVGGPSPGHEDEVDRLRAEAAARGVALRVTGGLPDDAFHAALRGPGVPVAAHRHLSASRTLLDWGEAGRRPLVVDSRYAREMAALRPGTLALYPPADLPAHLARAWADPAATALPPGASLAPTLADAAAAYLAWWAAGARAAGGAAA
jgi:glycosyltransferase involved in cell wall biosynthesis